MRKNKPQLVFKTQHYSPSMRYTEQKIKKTSPMQYDSYAAMVTQANTLPNRMSLEFQSSKKSNLKKEEMKINSMVMLDQHVKSQSPKAVKSKMIES